MFKAALSQISKAGLSKDIDICFQSNKHTNIRMYGHIHWHTCMGVHTLLLLFSYCIKL